MSWMNEFIDSYLVHWWFMLSYWIINNSFKKKKKGVPAMVQWVKNLTVVAQVAVKLQVQSLTWGSGLKDVVLPQLQLRFNLWRRNLHMLQVWP